MTHLVLVEADGLLSVGRVLGDLVSDEINCLAVLLPAKQHERLMLRRRCEAKERHVVGTTTRLLQTDQEVFNGLGLRNAFTTVA